MVLTVLHTGDHVRKPLAFLSCFIAGAVVVAGVLAVYFSRPARPLATVQTTDGRLFEVEGVTYGTNHVMGARSLIVERLGPWLPKQIRERLSPIRPQSTVELKSPGLVVWVNARDPVTGKQVDCQGVRLEFEDQHRDLFGEETSSWFGGVNFWRVGHIFPAFPRSERELTLRIVPWNKPEASVVTIPNPHVVTPAPLPGRSLPQRQRLDELELVLESLTVRTNGSPGQTWQTRSTFWQPQWALRQSGTNALGWDEPEWTAQDNVGNRSQFLGVHQAALRFSAAFYPNATNRAAALLITNAPVASLLGPDLC